MTLWLYIARRFLTMVLACFLAVLTLVVIVDLVELMRANRQGNASFLDLLGMAFLHAPSITITGFGCAMARPSPMEDASPMVPSM